MRKLLLLVFIIAVSCSEKNNVSFSYLEDHLNDYSSIDSLVHYPKEVIPFLISHISDTTYIDDILRDPRDSYIDPYYIRGAMNIRKGVLFAYYLDYYLSYSDSLEILYQKEIKERGGSMKGRFFFRNFHPSGIIIKQKEDRDNEDESLTPFLSAEDMLLIQSQYDNWWSQYKDLSVEQLRVLFKGENGILKSPYYWI